MSIISLVGVELRKMKHSKIILLLFIPIIILWLPAIFNAHLNFDIRVEGMTPEINFLIQGLLGMTWFIFPASMIVCTVLLNQMERSNQGILKMLSLPVNPVKICVAKFLSLLFLAAIQILLNIVIYYISALIVTQTQGYSFVVSPTIVLREAGYIYISAIPMLAFFWMLATCIHTPIFASGIGLASIVPSVLMINTKAWIVYPICYPFYVITSEYGRMATGSEVSDIVLLPWILIAALFTIIFLSVAGWSFAKFERR